MRRKMKAAVLEAEWKPREDFKLGAKDTDGNLTYLGSQVWKNPQVRIEDRPIPIVQDLDLDSSEALIRVSACGICGSDVHMAQADKEGYIFYPGLTAFPVVLGHEFSGVVVKAGARAINKRTGKLFERLEPVTAEEMFWCGQCKPCCDGYPNHCERLQELGFSVDGAMTEYVKVDAKYLWSLGSLKERYKDDKIFLAGSLVEPTSVAYNAVIERGGGIRPGEDVVILGGGPIGLAAIAILKRMGASKVILSEPSQARAKIGKALGADVIVNPLKENLAEVVLYHTNGMGAKLYLEATGLPDRVWSDIEKCIWEGRQINSTVVIVARAEAKIPLTGEVFQVRRARVVGAQGHSGHGTFANVISLMASGMDMTPLITKEIYLNEVSENLKLLQRDKEQCKITVLP